MRKLEEELLKWKRRRFNIKRLDKSFKYAFDGLKFKIKTEPNLKFHLIIGFIVMLGGVFFKISTIEMDLLSINNRTSYRSRAFKYCNWALSRFSY